MMKEEILKDAEKDVRIFLKKEGVENYKLEMLGQSESGENYLGEIIFYKITSEEGGKNYDLVVKTSKRNEFLREKVKSAYDRELFVYTEVFPAFRKFIEECNADIELDFVPKLYWTCRGENRETLIMGNLKSEGFVLHDRSKPWNLKHSLLAMKNYGKYHGISLALRKKNPKLFEKLTENMTNVFDDFSKEMDISNLYGKPVKEALEILEKAGRSDLIPKFDGIYEEIPEIIRSRGNDEDKIVITHGDCWNNNFLFKYQNDEKIPSRMVFLDFQLVDKHTPIIDLSYNIYATCDKACLDNFDLLLKTYHNSLSKTVEELGCKTEELFSFEKLMEHWMKYSKFGLLLSTLIIKIAIMPKEDAPSFDDFKEDNFDSFFNDLVIRNQTEYNNRIRDVFVHYAERFL